MLATAVVVVITTQRRQLAHLSNWLLTGGSRHNGLLSTKQESHLDHNRVNGSTKLEAAFLEHKHSSVIDACPCNQKGSYL